MGIEGLFCLDQRLGVFAAQLQPDGGRKPHDEDDDRANHCPALAQDPLQRVKWREALRARNAPLTEVFAAWKPRTRLRLN
jgi:hypothetical protein